MSESDVTIYTDGAAFPNPGTGGWSAIIIRPECEPIELFGTVQNVTNNQMELTGALEGLRRTVKGERIIVVSDSQYLINGITGWLANWKAKGWHTKTGPVKNVELWKELEKACMFRRIEWQWVKGHSGNEWNERADKLAFDATGATSETLPWWAKKSKHDKAQA